MKLIFRLTNRGIEIVNSASEPLEPSSDADQKKPRGYYVYAHLDHTGQIFYIGKGKGRRAWDSDRHLIWNWYVEKHLQGDYQVKILHDNLSAQEAEDLEAAWIAQCPPEKLVNWINMARDYDQESLDMLNKLRNENRSLIDKAKVTEKVDVGKAALMYTRAVEAIQGYAFISYETGIVGQCLEEWKAEVGFSGEVYALNRLTVCLIKLGKLEEAIKHTDNYFKTYKADLHSSYAEPILKRINKARVKIQK